MWNDKGADLKFPDGSRHQVAVVNNCPYASLETVKAIQKFKQEVNAKRLRKERIVKAFKST